MRKIIATLLVLCTLCSLLPVVSFAEGEQVADKSTYGLKENPVFIPGDTKSLTYEVEDYPASSYQYKRWSDPEASGGAAFDMNEGVKVDGKSVGNTQVSGDLVPYKLYLKAEKYTKIRIFVRAKADEDQKSKFRCSINDARTVQRTAYVVEGPEEWGWVLCGAYELSAGETYAFNFQFISTTYKFDKFFITTDMLFTPSGMGEEFHEIKLGDDTTPYENFKYPLPPFTPKKTRPRVYIDADRVESVKANLDHPENKVRYDAVVQHAATLPKDFTYSKANKYIWCNAFLYLLSNDPKHGRTAIDSAFTMLTQESGMTVDTISKSSGNERVSQLMCLAIIYDWCNPLLSDEEKLSLIGYILHLGSQLEHPYPTYATIGRGNGHESEGDIFAGLLSCAISIYEDFPEMWNVVGGLIFEEMLSTRNVFYENGYHTQGSHYKGGRMACEFHLISLLEHGVSKGLINGNPDDCLMDYVLSIRPDGEIFRKGDTGRSSGKQVFSTTLSTLFSYGNFYNNPYLKDLWYTSAPNPPFGYTFTGLSDVFFLMYNDPTVERRSYQELPLTVYLGDKSGMMYARSSWEKGGNSLSNQMQVRLNMETFSTGGHDHLDAGHFDIYYKGMLAIDSGHYGTEPYVDANGEIEDRAGMGSLHQGTWYARTIAHNCMLLYDPNETWKRWSTAKVNDGGQLNVDNSGESLEDYIKIGTTAKVLGADYGDDMYAPSFSYMKGDLTPAYNSKKMEQYTRSFVFLNFFDDVYPGALIVFDRMVSKNPEFKKTWLLHTQQEPIVKGNTAIADKTEEGDSGRIINTTLYPKADNLDLTTIGGPGKEFWHSGWNWYAVHKHEPKEYGEWRLEVSPKKASAEDCFLNVIHVTEATDTIKPLQAELIETENFLGAKIKDRIAFFSKNEGRSDKEINVEITGDENYEILFTDVQEGQWIVYKDGKEYTRVVATTNGGDFSFKGTKGTYRIVRNKRSEASFTRDMNWRNHTKDLGSDYTYFTFNQVTTDIPYLVENDKLYVDALKIAQAAYGRAEIKEGKIIFYGFKDAKLEIPVDNEGVKKIDGRYLINQELIKEHYFLTYSVYHGFIHDLKGGLATQDIEYLREEGMAYVIGIEQDELSYAPEYPYGYAIDKDISSYWQIENAGGYITLTFDRVYTISQADIIWSKVRGHDMLIETSLDGKTWTKVYDQMTPTCKSASDYESYDLYQTTQAKYVRITGRGNNSNASWFAIKEVRFPVPYEEWLASENAVEDEENTEDTENTEDEETDDDILTDEELAEGHV